MAISFIFNCKADPAHHPPHHHARMSTGHGTKNIQDGVKACNSHLGSTTSAAAVKSSGPSYSAAAHCTMIDMQCAKNHHPFNSVLDEDCQAEVKMLCLELSSPLLKQCHMISNLSMLKCLRMFRIISWLAVVLF